MHEEAALNGTLLDGPCLTLEDIARAAAVSLEWLTVRIDEGLIAASGAAAADWRFSPGALQRVRRMSIIERDFEAGPELAALVADLLEEVDALRNRLESAGLL
jgi:chaperone modulatory protein CbpM